MKTRTIVPHLPAKTRARVLASARATVASGGASPPAPLLEVQAPVPPPLPRRWIQPVVRISLAALAALAAASVGAVLALRARPDRRPPVVGQQQLPLVAPPVGTATAPFRPPAPAAMEEPSVGVTSTRPPRRAGARARFTAGLELLQRAHAAYTRHEFLGALALIGEHARRFPAGSLAEEREALRVRALLGCGRVEEAQHAAATFAVRFPRSVLLPRVHDQDKAPE